METYDEIKEEVQGDPTVFVTHSEAEGRRMEQVLRSLDTRTRAALFVSLGSPSKFSDEFYGTQDISERIALINRFEEDMNDFFAQYGVTK